MIWTPIIHLYLTLVKFLFAFVPSYSGLPADLVSVFNYFANALTAGCGYVSGVCSVTHTVILLAISQTLALLAFRITVFIFLRKVISSKAA